MTRYGGKAGDIIVMVKSPLPIVRPLEVQALSPAAAADSAASYVRKQASPSFGFSAVNLSLMASKWASLTHLANDHRCSKIRRFMCGQASGALAGARLPLRGQRPPSMSRRLSNNGAAARGRHASSLISNYDDAAERQKR